jgi:hypothetical protein
MHQTIASSRHHYLKVVSGKTCSCCMISSIYLIHISEEDEDFIMSSWEDAMEQCRRTLTSYDFAEVQRFTTPDKLAKDMKDKESSRPNFRVLRRPLSQLKSFFGFFLIAMQPRNLEGYMFWGLFYLLIDVCHT